MAICTSVTAIGGLWAENLTILHPFIPLPSPAMCSSEGGPRFLKSARGPRLRALEHGADSVPGGVAALKPEGNLLAEIVKRSFGRVAVECCVTGVTLARQEGGPTQSELEEQNS
ncbi:hypothetical protein EYF80_022312 [Liparis tanakae]|uniref:Uncharacterized protein n=1 Tax=Liparis tanakae TaxID=230148 RepID=A0A4Z2HNQ2_9TELE|nr:hypothetical protein EYF80_022312 [Liparis tanakae]